MTVSLFAVIYQVSVGYIFLVLIILFLIFFTFSALMVVIRLKDMSTEKLSPANFCLKVSLRDL